MQKSKRTRSSRKGKLAPSRKRRSGKGGKSYNQAFDQAYNQGYNLGFAKGFEDGHQIAYEQQNG
ncbi:hypothetical protein [Paenibacillus sp. R14(2021)]|uniref:hypothetical protein n=1 Tax=Paenibacillus sp. R14(2021) TaxID=2859228 RepID=UPI001C6138EA|nr:hypothetical protein [Paenibacillus sp. R14(2021)]